MKGKLLIMYDGIIFDMDGTLWDSRAAIVDCWNEVFEKSGLDRKITIDELTGYMGLPMDEIAESIFPDKKYDEVRDVFDQCFAEENDYLREHGGILYPGLEDTLKKLYKKFDLFIVSNCQSGYIEAFLEHHGLSQYFKDIECYGNNELQKADNIALVVKRNNLCNPVYVGDIEKDALAAKEAGVSFIFAEYGFGNVREYDGIIHKFTDLGRIGENK